MRFRIARDGLLHLLQRLARSRLTDAADQIVPPEHSVPLFGSQHDASVAFLDDEFRAGLPATGSPQRLGEKHLALGG